MLAFTKPSYVIKQSGSRAFIPISRIGGADGNVSVKWKTKDITAVDKKDYVGGEGVLTFDNQEARKNIEIFLYDSDVCSTFLLHDVMVFRNMQISISCKWRLILF